MDVLRLTLRQLQVFAAVATTGSTTAAGMEIALSQSATSAAVKELERLLSLPLFDRVGKRLLLNDNGRTLLPRARVLLDGAADIDRGIRSGAASLERLRIGASTTLGSYLLPRLLKSFIGSSPSRAGETWNSKIVIGNTASICQAVAGFELDIGLIEGPCHHSSLKVHPWLRDQLVIVASPHMSLHDSARRKSGARLPLKILRDLVWLLREPGSGTREATDQLLLPQLRAFPRSIEFASSEAIKHASAEGLGIACLSRWVVDDLITAGRLREVATTLRGLSRQCYWVVHRDKQNTVALDRFIECLGAITSPQAN
ncbi:MAG: LysR family transcriptional regulator [Steroidobacteraceae bacterium]